MVPEVERGDLQQPLHKCPDGDEAKLPEDVENANLIEVSHLGKQGAMGKTGVGQTEAKQYEIVKQGLAGATSHLLLERQHTEA